MDKLSSPIMYVCVCVYVYAKYEEIVWKLCLLNIKQSPFISI